MMAIASMGCSNVRLEKMHQFKGPGIKGLRQEVRHQFFLRPGGWNNWKEHGMWSSGLK